MKLPALDNPGGLAGAWIAPIRNVLARKDSVTWNHAHKGALKSAMANRQWTQQRLHKAGLSDSNLCQLCVGCENGDQVGTHLHRFFLPPPPSNRCEIWPPVGSETYWITSMAFFHLLSTVL